MNTAVTTNIKFQRLCHFLEKGESQSYCILIRFWNFVAANRAMTGSIADVAAWEIARFCWWNPQVEGKPELLIKALTDAGYISDGVNYPDEPAGAVHDWFENQPLAKEVLRARGRRQGEPVPSNASAVHNIRTPDISNVTKTKQKGTKQKKDISVEDHNAAMTFESQWNKIADDYHLRPLDLSAQTAVGNTRRKNILEAVRSKALDPELLFSKWETSPFLQGNSDLGFRPTVDWLFQSKKGIPNYVRIQDGAYNSNSSESARRKDEPPFVDLFKLDITDKRHPWHKAYAQLQSGKADLSDFPPDPEFKRFFKALGFK